MKIEFSGEAFDSFSYVIRRMAAGSGGPYVVRVDKTDGSSMDVELSEGVTRDFLRVRRYDEAVGEAIGESFDLNLEEVECIYVY